MPTASLWTLQAPELTVHPTPLSSEGICTDSPTAPLCSLKASALTRPLLAPVPHAHCLYLPSTLISPLHPSHLRNKQSHTYCLLCSSTSTFTAISNGHHWPLQVSAITCPLPTSALCRHLYSHAHCAPLLSVGICTHMPTAPLCPQQVPTYPLPLSDLCRHCTHQSHIHI